MSGPEAQQFEPRNLPFEAFQTAPRRPLQKKRCVTIVGPDSSDTPMSSEVERGLSYVAYHLPTPFDQALATEIGYRKPLRAAPAGTRNPDCGLAGIIRSGIVLGCGIAVPVSPGMRRYARSSELRRLRKDEQ